MRTSRFICGPLPIVWSSFNNHCFGYDILLDSCWHFPFDLVSIGLRLMISCILPYRNLQGLLYVLRVFTVKFALKRRNRDSKNEVVNQHSLI